MKTMTGLSGFSILLIGRSSDLATLKHDDTNACRKAAARLPRCAP
jgi:hypothetical protein